MKPFHRDVFMPKSIPAAFNGRTLSLNLTTHARLASHSDRYGKLALPASLAINGAEIVEAEVGGEYVEKIVVRTRYNAELDAVYVLLPEGDEATLKTVWFNKRTDTHKTLRRELYATAA